MISATLMYSAQAAPGSAIEYGVMGDVYVITATVDYDLGHHADPANLPTSLMPPGIMMIPMIMLPIRF